MPQDMTNPIGSSLTKQLINFLGDVDVDITNLYIAKANILRRA